MIFLSHQNPSVRGVYWIPIKKRARSNLSNLPVARRRWGSLLRCLPVMGCELWAVMGVSMEVAFSRAFSRAGGVDGVCPRDFARGIAQGRAEPDGSCAKTRTLFRVAAHTVANHTVTGQPTAQGISGDPQNTSRIGQDSVGFGHGFFDRHLLEDCQIEGR